MTKSKVKNLLLTFVLLLGFLAPVLTIRSSVADAQKFPVYTGSDGVQYSKPIADSVTKPGVFTGVGVTLSKNAKTALSTKYIRDPKSADPWYGGKFQVDWSSMIDAHVDITNINKLLGMAMGSADGAGFGFIATINLPETVKSTDVITGIDESSAVLKIGNSEVKLTKRNFEAVDAHTLRLTIRKHNIDDTSLQVRNTLLGKMLQAVYDYGKFQSLMSGEVKDIPVSFSVQVDVATMMAKGLSGVKDDQGNEVDPTPGKVLTTKRLPPARNNGIDISVDFYDMNNIVQLRYPGASDTHAETNPDAIYPAPNAQPNNHATSSIFSWDSYISPYDSQGTYNTIDDPSETIAGNTKNIAGAVGNRLLTMNPRVETWKEIDAANPARFNRVVNIFSKQDVTDQYDVSHPADASVPFNTQAPVSYSATSKSIVNPNDQQLMELSPVNLKVLQEYKEKPSFKVQDIITISDEKFGGPQDELVVSKNIDPAMIHVKWKAPYMKSGKIVYRIYPLAAGDASYKEDQTLVPETILGEISNDNLDPNVEHDLYGPLSTKKLDPGVYYIDFRIIDNSGDPATITPWMSYVNKTGTFFAPSGYVLGVAEVDSFTANTTLESEKTGESGQDITTTIGDTITERSDFTYVNSNSKSDKPLKDITIEMTAPKNTTIVDDSVIVEYDGKKIANPKLQIKDNKLTVKHDVAWEVGKKTVVSYKYKLSDTLKSGTVIHSNSAVLYGSTWVPLVPGQPAYEDYGASVYAPLAYSIPGTITIPPEVFQLLKAPSDFTFGTIEKPYLPNTEVTAQFADEAAKNFQVRNTYAAGAGNDSWIIQAQITKPFTNGAGEQLQAGGQDIGLNLSFEGQNPVAIGNDVATVYTNKSDARNDIDIPLKKLTMNIPGNSNASTDAANDKNHYSGEITWSATKGPTE